MPQILRDFISDENREYKFRIGKLLASSLTGFICGVIFASIVWATAVAYLGNSLL